MSMNVSDTKTLATQLINGVRERDKSVDRAEVASGMAIVFCAALFMLYPEVYGNNGQSILEIMGEYIKKAPVPTLSQASQSVPTDSTLTDDDKRMLRDMGVRDDITD